MAKISKAIYIETMAEQDMSFDEHWEYWRNRDALRNVLAAICESNKNNKSVVLDKRRKKVRCDSIFTYDFVYDFLCSFEIEGGK